MTNVFFLITRMNVLTKPGQVQFLTFFYVKIKLKAANNEHHHQFCEELRCLDAMRMSRFRGRGPCWVAVGV